MSKNLVLDNLGSAKLSWRWPVGFLLFFFAIVGFSSGVSLTERPDLVTSSLLAKGYYSLGLFVVGGLDIGIPVGGPLFGRILLWIAYFGSPFVAASAVGEVLLKVMSPHAWQLRRLKNHIVIVGSGDMVISYLRVLRRGAKNTQVVVIDHAISAPRELELTEAFDVTVVAGDITQDFLLKALRLDRAKRVMLMGEDDFLSFEAASKIVRQFPHLKSRIVIHSNSLRFLRAMQGTRIASHSINFNSYNLAAKALVRDRLKSHFLQTAGKDHIILAGFGLFGQTILEELQSSASEHIAMFGIIDLEADRRILVVEEQEKLEASDNRKVFQGDIAHPEVWRNVRKQIDLSQGYPVIILGTGDASTNLRTALWLRQKHPNALVFSRTKDTSQFALEVGEEHKINSISITHLVETNIPLAWFE